MATPCTHHTRICSTASEHKAIYLRVCACMHEPTKYMRHHQFILFYIHPYSFNSACTHTYVQLSHTRAHTRALTHTTFAYNSSFPLAPIYWTCSLFNSSEKENGWRRANSVQHRSSCIGNTNGTNIFLNKKLCFPRYIFTFYSSSTRAPI